MFESFHNLKEKFGVFYLILVANIKTTYHTKNIQEIKECLCTLLFLFIATKIKTYGKI